MDNRAGRAEQLNRPCSQLAACVSDTRRFSEEQFLLEGNSIRCTEGLVLRRSACIADSRILADRCRADRVKRMTKGQRLDIGDLSKVAGVKVVTIRYCEQIGLMPVAPRNKGTRDLHGEYVHSRQFIRRLRDHTFAVVESGKTALLLEENLIENRHANIVSFARGAQLYHLCSFTKHSGRATIVTAGPERLFRSRRTSWA